MQARPIIYFNLRIFIYRLTRKQSLKSTAIKNTHLLYKFSKLNFFTMLAQKYKKAKMENSSKYSAIVSSLVVRKAFYSKY